MNTRVIPLWGKILILTFIVYQALITYHDKYYCHCTVGGDYYAYYQFGHGVRGTGTGSVREGNK